MARKMKFENFLAAVRSAGTDEEEMDELESLGKPETFKDKADLGEQFDEFFGFNPITYHDREYLSQCFDDIVKRAPETMRASLRDSKEETIESVMTHKENLDEEYMYQILLAQIYSDTGWMPEEEKVNMNSAIIDEVAGVDVPFSYDDEDDSEEDTEDDSDDEEDFMDDEDDL